MSDLASTLTDTAFLRCERCGGMGFLKQGVFAERSFPTCPTCKGLGQAYLTTADKAKTDFS